MPTPYVPQTVTITDYFEDGAGNPLDGRVIFTPSVTSKTPGGTITRHPIVAKVTGGNLSVVLIAPDSTGVAPQGWTYDVRTILGPPGSAGAEGIDAFSSERWSIRPTAAAPAVVLRDLTPVDPVPQSAFAVRSVAGVLPDVGGNIALTAADLEAAGVGFATQAAVDALNAELDGVEVTVGGHTTAIAANTANIGTNTANIATNTANIASNTTAIAGKLAIPAGGSFPSSIGSANSLGSSSSGAPLDHVHRLTSNTPTDGDTVQRISGAWQSRTAAQAKATLGITIADVASLQTTLDDNTWGTSDLGNLGDYVSSIPRYAASSQDSLSNQFLTFHGAIAMRSSFTATRLRLHVRGAVGSPGIVTLALFKGSNRTALTKVVADSVVTTAFGTTGPKEFTFSGVTVNRGEFVFLALLHTNAGTDPILSTLPGPPSADLINPSSTQMISGYKSGQTSIPATLDTSASFTANARVAWFALAP